MRANPKWIGALGAALILVPTAAQAAPDGTPPMPPPNEFVRHVTNSYFPLIPGTTFVYSGVEDGGTAVDIVQVTDDTELIQGVVATAVSDRVYIDGHLRERTTDW